MSVHGSVGMMHLPSHAHSVDQREAIMTQWSSGVSVNFSPKLGRLLHRLMMTPKKVHIHLMINFHGIVHVLFML